MIVMPPHTQLRCDIAYDEDWIDPLPQIMEEDGVPATLWDKDIWIYIRPRFGHPTLVKRLSLAEGTIIVDSWTEGMVSINVSRADVISSLRPGKWDWFGTLEYSSPRMSRELFRGDLVVHPGRTGTL